MSTISPTNGVTSSTTSGWSGQGLVNKSFMYATTGSDRRCRHFGHDRRHRHHVGGILDCQAHRAVIGMVITGAMRKHEVGSELSNLADDSSTHVERRLQFAVRKIPHFVFESIAASDLGGLPFAE